ncbi:hypothetical protein BDY24DRAFT_369652 [Mrakia frigida]|uniref:uncharacterized protein n=1 Tax=Mrakia frigida TaxID=29902 RepID=UPI003FCBF7F0
MTEFWKSTKKWHCKYCDIHINDDAPSRQLHETGFRHIGNKERHLREIYKSGERKQKDADHEKKEIARMEKAAQAAYALDLASGAVLPGSSQPPPSSSSKPTAPAKPKTKYDSYTTAADLGFTDPDAVDEVPLDPAEEEEREKRKSEGRVGTWEVVAAPPPPASPPPPPGADYSSAEGSGSGSRNRGGAPRVVPKGDHDDDAAESRSFKFVRKDKRPLNWGMLDQEEEGEIVVKVKEKEEGLMAKRRKLEEEEEEEKRKREEKLVWKPVAWGSRIGEGGEVVEGENAGVEEAVVGEEKVEEEEEKKVEVVEEVVVAAPPVTAAAPLFKKRRGAPAGVGKKPKF